MEQKPQHVNPHLQNIQRILEFSTNEQLKETVLRLGPDKIDPEWAEQVANIVHFPLKTQDHKDET